MHEPAIHQQPRLWLLAGTGDGLRLALELRRRGWRLLVCVVSAEAALAYPASADLELRVGAIEGAAGIRSVLEQARRGGAPFTAVVDASHPFARQITAALADVWEAPGLPPLLRLRRPDPGPGTGDRLQVLPDLEALAELPLHGCRLLLAIGARQLGQAVVRSPGAVHHARLLPNAAALQQGQAAGLAPERLACLQPGDTQEHAVLRALLGRWRIEAILCRQSGGLTEQLWRRLASELNLELLLLARPPEPAGLRQLQLQPLLEALEALHPAPTLPGCGKPPAP